MICDPAIIPGTAARLPLVSSAPHFASSRETATNDAAHFDFPAKNSPPNKGKAGPFGRPVVAFLLLALPALWAGWLIYYYGVDTPWGDEWDSTRLLLEKFQAGTLQFADFFAFHNEHRIFFPRLLTFGLAQLTHWNVRAELLVIWILACVCSLNFLRMAQITGWRKAGARHWLLLATNILLFSPLQWENLLWGFQIGFFLPLATITACLWFAPSLRRPFDFLATMALCLITTFSIASGFASWLLAAPLLCRLNRKMPVRGEKGWWLIWLFVAAVSTWLYFQGYTRPAAHPSTSEALKHPLLAIQFILAYLGTPFSSGTALDASAVASVAGAVLIIPLVGCVLYVWRWRGDRTLLAQALPWVSLAGWALVNASLTMFGRVGFGIPAATQSRYVSFAIMLPIGLLFLGHLVFRHWRAQANSGANRAGPARGLIILVTGLSLLVVCGTIKSLETWERFQHNRMTGKALLLLINAVDEPKLLVRYVHWAGPSLKGWANTLDSMGCFRPALVRSKHIRDIAFTSDPGVMGELEEIGETASGEFTLTGWAILPESRRIADSVLLTYDDDQGEPTIFALAEVGIKRAANTPPNNGAYSHCGWIKSWKADKIPASAQWIRAWTFDAENCRAFQIGVVSLKPPPAAP